MLLWFKIGRRTTRANSTGRKRDGPLRYPPVASSSSRGIHSHSIMSRCTMSGPRIQCTLWPSPMASSCPAPQLSASSSEWSPPSGTAPRNSGPPHNRIVAGELVYSHRETVDLRTHNLGLKYRVWYTWYLMETLIPETAEDAVLRRAEFWAAMVSGDLWLWEEEDEECIRVFVDSHHFLPILEMPREYWDIACGGPAGRYGPRDTSLHHLTPQTRLLFIAWLIVSELGRKHALIRQEEIDLSGLIWWWGICTNMAMVDLEDLETCCEICEVSQIMKCWMETMLEVYLVHDLGAMLWRPGCDCFHMQVSYYYTHFTALTSFS